MRPSIPLALALLSMATPAVAGSRTGGGSSGGGGPLSGTSSGIGDAVRGGGNGGGGGGGGTVTPPTRDPDCCREDRDRYYYDATGALVLAGVAGSGVALRERPPEPDPKGYHGSTVHGFLGGHLVKDSDGALAADLAFQDGRFRVVGRGVRYYERLPDQSLLKMNHASLMGGLRIDDLGNTAVFVEAGVAYNKTSGDPVMDTNITGMAGGIHVEHWLNRNTRALADAHLMVFPDDIRATSARVGLRFGHFQAAFRVLDFNVGPPLYGPELGLAF